MGLIVESVTMRDFMSYGPQGQTIKFGGRGPVAITGKNGAGKSSATSRGLCWCLYGKCPPERHGTRTKAIAGKAVIRNRPAPAAKEAKVWVRLVDPDTGDWWSICRSRNRTKGDRITMERKTSTGGQQFVPADQSDIDRLVGADYGVFVRTVVRGQNDVYNFAEATDARKREIIEAVSGAVVLDEPFVNAKARAKQAQAQATHYQAMADEATRRGAGIDLGAIEAKRAGWAAEHASKVIGAEGEVAQYVAMVATEKANDEAGRSAQEARNLALSKKPTLDIKPYTDAVANADSAFRAASKEGAAMDAKWDQVAHLEPGHDCPTCGQVIAPTAPIAAQRAALEAPHAAAVDVASKAVTALNHARDVKRDAQAWLVAEVAKWQAGYDAMPVAGKSRVPLVEASLATAQRRLDDLRTATNPHDGVLAHARKQRQESMREAAIMGEAARQAGWSHDVARAWMDALGPKGARAHLGDSVLTAIEAGANTWLALLSGGTMSVEFKPTREGSATEDIQTIITVNTGDGPQAQPMLNFSGGEKCRINFAVDLGVASVFVKGGGLKLSLLVLDEETFSGMDDDGKRSVALALSEAGVADVVIVDHDPRLASALGRTVNVSKDENGYSVVKEVAA